MGTMKYFFKKNKEYAIIRWVNVNEGKGRNKKSIYELSSRFRTIKGLINLLFLESRNSGKSRKAIQQEVYESSTIYFWYFG